LLIWLLFRPARLDRNDPGNMIEAPEHKGDFHEP
jgi:hypothetical protein